MHGPGVLGPQASRLAGGPGWQLWRGTAPGPSRWSLRARGQARSYRAPTPRRRPCRTLGDFHRVCGGLPSSRGAPGTTLLWGRGPGVAAVLPDAGVGKSEVDLHRCEFSGVGVQDRQSEQATMLRGLREGQSTGRAPAPAGPAHLREGRAGLSAPAGFSFTFCRDACRIPWSGFRQFLAHRVPASPHPPFLSPFQRATWPVPLASRPPTNLLLF